MAGTTKLLTPGGGGVNITPSGSISSDITLSLPITTDTIVGRATTDTLSNKTLTSMNGDQIAGFRNWVLNGDMSVVQAGTSFANPASGTYTLDGWMSYGAGTTCTIAQVAYIGNFQYALRTQRNSGATVVTVLQALTSFETRDVIKLAGKTLTLSFRGRIGANFSGTSNQLSVNLYYGTGTDGNIVAGFTGQTMISGTAITMTTSDGFYSITFTLPSTATQFGIQILYTTAGTAGAADYFDITGVQLEVGSVATPFEQITFQQNLQRCMRYYEYISQTIARSQTASGTVYIYQWFKVQKRTGPTMSLANTTYSNGSAAGTNLAGINGVELYFTTTATNGYVLTDLIAASRL